MIALVVVGMPIKPSSKKGDKMTAIGWVLIGLLILGVISSPSHVGKIRTVGSTVQSLLLAVALITYIVLTIALD